MRPGGRGCRVYHRGMPRNAFLDGQARAVVPRQKDQAGRVPRDIRQRYKPVLKLSILQYL